MREAEENIKFKIEIDVLVPIPRTVTRDFTSLKHLRQWQKRNDSDGSLYCFAHREYLLNEKGEWEQFTVIGKQVVAVTTIESFQFKLASRCQGNALFGREALGYFFQVEMLGDEELRILDSHPFHIFKRDACHDTVRQP